MAVTKFLARDLAIAIQIGTGSLSTPARGSVTGPFSTHLLTSVSHGLLPLQRMQFSTISGGAGLSTAVDYFVIPGATLTADTFKLAASSADALSGAVVNFTTDVTAGTFKSDGNALQPIGGLHTLTHAPSVTEADTTTFSSAGHAEHMSAQRSEQWTLAGFTLEDVATGTRDAGQTAVEALAQLTGLTSLGTFRVTSPGGNTVTFTGSASVTLSDGGNNDAAKWQVVIKVSGASVYSAGGGL